MNDYFPNKIVLGFNYSNDTIRKSPTSKVAREIATKINSLRNEVIIIEASAGLGVISVSLLNNLTKLVHLEVFFILNGR